MSDTLADAIAAAAMAPDDGSLDFSRIETRRAAYIPQPMADEAALFGSIYVLNLWRDAGSPKNVNLQTALLALHTATRSANAAISARAAAELARLT